MQQVMKLIWSKSCHTIALKTFRVWVEYWVWLNPKIFGYNCMNHVHVRISSN
jgi:hypothetical protein